MDANIKTGTIVYNRSGEKGRYEGLLNGIHYVTPEVITYGWEGEEDSDWGATTTWPEVFPKPPTAKLEDQVAELSAQVAASQTELLNLGKSREASAKEWAAREKQVSEAQKKYPAFQRVFDFLDNKITHAVVLGYNTADIKTFDEVFLSTEDHSRQPRKFKLVTLQGDVGGDMSYRINHYSDGSGYSTEILPANSYEEALSLASGFYDTWTKAEIALLAAGKTPNRVSDLEAMSIQYNFAFPDKLRDWLQAVRKWNADQKVRNAEVDLLVAQVERDGGRALEYRELVSEGLSAAESMKKWPSQYPPSVSFEAASVVVLKRANGLKEIIKAPIAKAKGGNHG